jgi:hypothetical protein
MRLSHRTTVAVGLAPVVLAASMLARAQQAADTKGATEKSPPPKAEEKAESLSHKPSFREGEAPPEPGSTAAPSPSKEKAKPKDEPRVLTKAEVEARRNSPFLLRPGTSPGDPPSKYDSDDASDDPPWRQAAFFGVRARGLFFVYVLDQSGSMVDDDRLTRATIELRRSVFALRSPQRFEVIFYNDEATAMPGGPIPRPADLHNKQLLTSWLRLIDPDGETDPRGAIQQALALRPDAVFLLSDGEFPEKTAATIAQANPHKVPIHCIDLAGGAAQGSQLKQIARDSGGQYKSRP